MELLSLLQTRNSESRLVDPAPGPDELEQIFLAALRSPDHASLTPWKFVVIDGDRREDFGELLARALKSNNPGATEEEQENARKKALRAPMIVAVACVYQAHPKVPRQEQLLSAGCAAFSILLAAESLGYAGIWRTGPASFEPLVWKGLGLADNEEVVGFLYLGTREGPGKPLPCHAPEDFVDHWEGLRD